MMCLAAVVTLTVVTACLMYSVLNSPTPAGDKERALVDAIIARIKNTE